MLRARHEYSQRSYLDTTGSLDELVIRENGLAGSRALHCVGSLNEAMHRVRNSDPACPA